MSEGWGRRVARGAGQVVRPHGAELFSDENRGGLYCIRRHAEYNAHISVTTEDIVNELIWVSVLQLSRRGDALFVGRHLFAAGQAPPPAGRADPRCKTWPARPGHDAVGFKRAGMYATHYRSKSSSAPGTREQQHWRGHGI